MKPCDWSVYVVRCVDSSLYTGVAKDVAARVATHNAGRGAAYTRARRPVRLVYRRDGLSRSAALIEEARIKALDRVEKIAFVRRAKALALAAALALAWLLPGAAGAVPVFDKENGIVLAQAAPLAFTGDTGVSAYAPLRMYYLALTTGIPAHLSSGTAILSATSVDGVTWVTEAGVRVGTITTPSVSISSITGCTVQKRTDGSYRMLFSIVSTTGAFRIHSATSADGLAWGNQSAVAVDGAATYVGMPRIVALDSGDWRLYYARDTNGGDDLADRRLYTARSTDEGATWGESSLVLSTVAYDAGAAKLTDGRVRLFFSQPAGAASSATVISSALSSDALGSSFSQESDPRLSTAAASGSLGFPVPVRSTDSYRWRLYYSFFDAASSTGDVRSAITGSPAPVSATPATVYRSAAASALTISGEVFSAAPTVALTNGAATITGTSVNRSDDQTIAATFATQNQALGSWDLVVTNAGGDARTLANAVTIDFAPGSVLATNNLLRPRDGTPTTLDVTIYTAGRVTVRVHDTEGRALRTLFDAHHDEGSFTVSWDGRDATGAPVASGLYAIVTNGPKISKKTKVVLIK